MTPASQDLIDIKGIQIRSDAFVVVVRTEWNRATVDALTAGCLEVLHAVSVGFEVIEVPGAFEIPFIIQHHHKASPRRAHAFIALGCVIRGDTPHFDHVCNGVTQGLLELNLNLPAPVINGVLTVNDQLQANERMGGRSGHKGKEAAAAAIKMIAAAAAIAAK